MKTKPAYFLFCLFFAGGCFLTPLHAADAPVVSQVSFVQEVVVNPGARRVTVTYTLAHPDGLPCTVTLAADRDGSGAYETLTAVSGAVGVGVTSSSGGLVKTAVWDVGASPEWAKVLYPSVRIRVAAATGTVAPPSGSSFVTVGDAGNAADPATTYGAVGYEFQIQKFEFTNGEYVEFLNAVGGTNPNGIYTSSMGSDPRGGITQSGVSPNFTYALKANMGDKPVNYVSWFEAARVANWLHNGRSTNPALLETGAYTLNNATTGVGFTKNAGATYWVPSEDEWYKAAYYKGGGTSAGYWIYPTKSDIAPAYVTAGGTGVGSAGLGSTANSINGLSAADWNGQDGNVTTVGSNGGPSAYGTYDMGGNLWEWDDKVDAGSNRVYRGGGWNFNANNARSGNRSINYPVLRYDYLGFRLARSSVPAQSVPTQLGLRTQPVGSVSGGALSPQPVVELRDPQGNLVVGGSSGSVTVTIVSGSGGTLGGTTTVTAVDGVATFTDLTLSGTVGENYVLRFSATGLTSVDSAPVTVNLAPYGSSFVTVGDAGNAADAATTYGAVGYEFQIQKFEFTNGEYVEFLNAVGGSNPNGIYQASMGSDARAGITQSGASPSFTYAVKANMGDKPVIYVSWFEAARVANWLHNGRLANPALLESGAYTLNNATSGVGFTKNAGATYWVPSEDEWYKAAYYKGGGVSAGYWAYPTKSDSLPTYVTATSTGVGSAGLGSTANSINVYGDSHADWNGQVGNVTTVGSNGGPSAYGTYDMGGNVWEWDDAVFSGSYRVFRGGGWDYLAGYAHSGSRNGYNPAYRYNYLGFRLARSSVP